MSVLGLRNTSLHLLEFIFEAPDVPGLLQKNFMLFKLSVYYCYLLHFVWKVPSLSWI